MKSYLLAFFLSFLVLPAFSSEKAPTTSADGAGTLDNQKQVALTAAKKWLSIARALPSDKANALKYTLENLKKSGGTLAEIEITATELDQLAADGYKADMAKALKKAQEPGGDYLQFGKFVQKADTALTHFRADLKQFK